LNYEGHEGHKEEISSVLRVLRGFSGLFNTAAVAGKIPAKKETF
jgi:hypothetical protein